MNIIRTVRWDTAHHENIYAESYRNHKREKASGYKGSNPLAAKQSQCIPLLIPLHRAGLWHESGCLHARRPKTKLTT